MIKTKIVFLCVIILAFATSGISLRAADSSCENPKAIYEKCIKLEEDIRNLMLELTKLNAELEAKKKMLANYEYVREENKKNISKLNTDNKH